METLKELYTMMDGAKTAQDIATVKANIQRTLFAIKQQERWHQNVVREGNRK